MKFVILSLILMSCGQNPYLTGKKGINLTGAIEGEEKPTQEALCNANLKSISVTPLKRSKNIFTKVPFKFKKRNPGNYTKRVIVHGKRRKIVENTQVVLPFNFGDLEIPNSALIRDIKLVYSASQIFNPKKAVKSQFCQSFKRICSGDFESVKKKVRHNHNYTWIDGLFSTYIENKPKVIDTPRCAERDMDVSWNLKPYLSASENITFGELPVDYTIFVAENHLMKDVKIEIEYCEI